MWLKMAARVGATLPSIVPTLEWEADLVYTIGVSEGLAVLEVGVVAGSALTEVAAGG